MSDVLPKIRVTDPQHPLERLKRQEAEKGVSTGSLTSLTSGKLAGKLWNPTSPTATNDIPSIPTQNGNETRKQVQEAAIDPLSQQILHRTNTPNASQKLQGLRTQTTDIVAGGSPTSPNESFTERANLAGAEVTRQMKDGEGKDKKKGVSFLSRFIGTSKKKTGIDGVEDESEPGEKRPEGMNAQLFSHMVDNLGFSPRQPPPPAYIKVRTKYKKQGEFNRVFLAQELRTSADKKAPPVVGSNPAPQSGAAASHNPIWATEFSKDGRFLAAGGQDRIVRVWAVISTPEERSMHEHDESGPSVEGGQATHLSAPVFQQKPLREYEGHTATVLDLSWSKNNFLLSSSMDKTVRLWHVSRAENLCIFKHTDFVPSIQFHPKDDRFFLAGSLDTKLRLWSIPDKSVAFWSQLPDMITSVAFTPDGKTCIAGTLSGLCMFYETEGLKYQTQIHVKSTRGQNAKGSKITGIQATHWPPGSVSGEVKLLISSNDSRVRLYNLRDKSLEMKFKGHENNCSQIRATFADDTGHVICGSEDRKAYIWSTCAPEGEKRNQRPMEMFDAHNSITTCAIIAPLKTRQLLSTSEDPIYDICNPPPVTLVSRAESVVSSRAPTDIGAPPTPAHTESNFRRAAETPAYIARSAHIDGNIIVTADYTGALKVFRQDCAFQKRARANDNWDNSSVFSKRTGSKIGRPSSIMSQATGRPSSIMSQATGRTRRDSTSTQPPNDRIISWRQDISHGSFDSTNGGTPRRSLARSVSPRKPLGKETSINSTRAADSPALGPTLTTDTASNRTKATPKSSLDNTPAASPSSSPQKSPLRSPLKPSLKPSPSKSKSPIKTKSEKDFKIDPKGEGEECFDPIKPPSIKLTDVLSNPMSIYNGQSWAFWNTNTWREQSVPTEGLQPMRPDMQGRLSTVSAVSKLSSEMPSEEEEEAKCQKCGSEEFKVRVLGTGGKEEKRLVCVKCGTPMS